MKDKKRVLHVLASNKYSGAENVVCTIIDNMSDEYEMAYCSPDGPIRDILNERNINYYGIKKLSIKNLSRIIKEFKPDIIHAHDNKATVLASFFAKKYKVISHIHGNNIIMNSLNIKTILFDFCSKKISKFIWVSDSSLDGYYFRKKIMNKSIVLYNIVDKKNIINKSKEYICDNQYDLIFLGRLGYPKNPERLIKIIKIVKEKVPNVKVAIVGDGPDRANVERIIKNYDLGNNIKMFGFVSNPFPILNNSKILIMTSIYEGTPMCALEAQSLGKPIVATPVDGLKKVVISGQNGFLSDSDELISSFIVDSLNNNSLMSKLSNNSIKNFNKYNDLCKYCNSIDNIYNTNI